jgi:hypothetical protein
MADIVILVLFPDTAIDSVAAFGSTPGMGIPAGTIWSFALLDDVCIAHFSLHYRQTLKSAAAPVPCRRSLFGMTRLLHARQQH